MSALAHLADVVIGLEPLCLEDGEGDLKDRYGLRPPYQDEALLAEIAGKLVAQYGLTAIAFTQREMEPTNTYQLKAYLYTEGHLYQSARQKIQALDRVGTGDAFTAGIIAGVLADKGPQEVLDIGMASFAYKHTIEGDSNVIGKADITAILEQQSFEIKR